MTSRSTRVKMRSRPIDVNRVLFLTDTSEKDIDEDAFIEPPPPKDPHGGDGTSKAPIPVPPIYVQEDYFNRHVYQPYTRPTYYIKFHLTPASGLLNPADKYDLLEEDMEWLSTYKQNNPKKPLLTEDELEKIIDLFEKEAAKITLRSENMPLDEKIDPSREFTMDKAAVLVSSKLNIKGKSETVGEAYKYWLDKRRRLGKALMKQYQEPPPKGNQDPHVAFRPRTEGRRISKRNPRKDDSSSYYKMLNLKRDFQRVIDVLDTIQIRETLKREQAMLNIQIFDQQLATTSWANKLVHSHPILQQCQQMSTNYQHTGALNQNSINLNVLNATTPTAISLPTLNPEQHRLWNLLHCAIPPASYTKAAMEETRKKQAKKMQKKAAIQSSATSALLAASASSSSSKIKDSSSSSSSSSSSKLSADGRPIIRDEKSSKKKDSSLRPPQIGSTFSSSSSTPSSVFSSGFISSSPSLLPPQRIIITPEMLAEIEHTDDEDMVSEGEDEQEYYREIEQYVHKRAKVKKIEPTASPTLLHKASPTSSPFSSPSSSPRASLHQYINNGGFVGRVRPRVARHAQVWLDVLWPHSSVLKDENFPSELLDEYKQPITHHLEISPFDVPTEQLFNHLCDLNTNVGETSGDNNLSLKAFEESKYGPLEVNGALYIPAPPTDILNMWYNEEKQQEYAMKFHSLPSGQNQVNLPLNMYPNNAQPSASAPPPSANMASSAASSSSTSSSNAHPPTHNPTYQPPSSSSSSHPPLPYPSKSVPPPSSYQPMSASASMPPEVKTM